MKQSLIFVLSLLCEGVIYEETRKLTLTRKEVPLDSNYSLTLLDRNYNMSLIPAFWGHRKKDLCEFETIHLHFASSMTVRAT